MKVALVQPRSFHTWEALNIGYLTSRLRASGYHDISFYSGFFDSDEEIVEGCKRADIVGFSCTSPQMKHALSLAGKIKRPDNHVVFGGVHPSALPEDVLKNPCVDAVVVGEGEQAFLDIVRGDLERIVRRPLIGSLDDIPFPDRRTVKQERNIREAYRDNGKRIAAIFSSRGCPFACVFCVSHAVWARKVRFRSAASMLDEFEQVVRDWEIDFMKFSDDTFTLSKKLVMEFCEEKLRRGINTEWGCNIRVDTTDEEMLRIMYRAGCREVWAGVESGSPRILEDMQKRITPEQVRRTFKVARDVGLFRRAYILLGMPNESLEDIRLTEDLVDEIDPDMVGFTVLAPFPGTVFYDEKRHRDVDWSVVDEYQNDMTRTVHLTNDDLRCEQRRLTQKYSDRLAFRNRELARAHDSGNERT
ncbi:MAG: B12-binding domain-containing radical SAM protein [Chloroflexi bacterium]|nr:B12-binding domain-containing radical SAM protein [Chloroflexota bacterium]